MKNNLIFSGLLLGLLAQAALAQPQFPPPPGSLPAPNRAIPTRTLHVAAPIPAGEADNLTKFDLDFSGGTPQQFIAAIEKAMGKPINAIIAEDQESVRIPPLRMIGVALPQLFASLREASVRYRYDNNNNQRQTISSLGFDTLDNPPSDTSIWRFSSYNAAQAPSALTRFNLNFSGGTPLMLTKAIEKATSKPLNVVIPPEHAEVKLPPLEMKNVDVQQLFEALQAASMKREAYVTGNAYGGLPTPAQSYQIANTAYGFRTQGRVTDESIWYFFAEKPVGPPLSPPKASRFYSLAPYIERGLSVDDITTAIQTSWKMLGDKDTPNISFHKDTKLLIAVGEPGKLETIDAVLRALQSGPMTITAEHLQRLSQQPTLGQSAGAKSTQPAKPAKPAPDKDAEN